MGLPALFAGAFLALTVPGVASAREWLFDVTLDGLSIGSHRYTLREDGDARHLTSDAHFRVRLLLIDAYRWDHHAEEAWRNDCLVTLDSATTEKGRTVAVTGRLEEGTFVLDGPAGQQSVGPCAMTFAYWNPRIFSQRMLVNPQTGAPTPVRVTALPRAQFTVRGQRVETGGYRVETEKTRIEAYYDATGEWVGLRSTTREGHVLEYRLH
jgi:hypothetical protein